LIDHPRGPLTLIQSALDKQQAKKQ
jgi:hypothetical protein